MKEKIESIINESIEVKRAILKSNAAKIENAAAALLECIKAGGKVLIFGNGGSAADSQHMAAELVGRFRLDRKALPAVALSTNTSTLTAVANDYGYEQTFRRQVEALGKKGDVAIAISTSGNSKNVISAVKEAKKMGLFSIALTGGGGGALAPACDTSIIVGSKNTARVQEAHILIIHIMAELIERGI